MFEKVEASDVFRAYLKKWEGKPAVPLKRDMAKHYTDILGLEADFFFETHKLSESAFNAIGDFNKERFHMLWAELRENGWRYFKLHESDPSKWYCIYPHLIRHKTDRVWIEEDVFVEERA